MLTLLGSSSSTTQGTNQLTVVPEDLPPITYRHTFVVIGRAQVYSAFVKMVCSSKAACYAICQKSHSSIRGNDSGHGSSRSDISLASNSSLHLAPRPSVQRPGGRKGRSNAHKCYCQIDAPHLPHSISRGQSRPVSLGRNQSPELRGATSNESTPICTSISGSVSMQRIHHSTIVSRVSFENVSYKYSSYIPRLSSATAVLNTALIFLLPLDPPPGNSKAATAASACTDCIRSLTGGDDARPSRWNTLMEDISMLELRLRQCQRMIDNWGKRFGKPLVSLVVLTAEHADSGRKPPTRRQEERLAVESLWRKWGPSGVGILGDRFDYEWNGDKLHSLVSDLSEILAQHWRTNSITAL